MMWTLIGIVIVIFVLTYLKNYVKTVILALKLKGPLAYPIIGNALTVNNSEALIELGTHGYKLYGLLPRCWISVLPFFFVLDPRHLQIILSSSKHTNKSLFYKLLHNFIGEGLITSSGTKWKLHRKLIQPSFHINILETFIPTFVKCAHNLLEKLENRKELNVTTFVNDYVLEVLHSSVLGVSLKDYESETPFRKGKVLFAYRVSRPWMLLDLIFSLTTFAQNELNQKFRLEEFTKKILKMKKSRDGKSAIDSPNFIEMFLQISQNNSNLFTDDDIVSEISTFMLAGQDSVGAAIVFSLYFLAQNQDVQDRALDELNEIFDTDREPTIEDINKMKYLEQCIKEAMRLCPSVPIVSRKLTEEVVLDDIKFPPGTNIFIAPFATHRLESYFPDPLKYDPERFSPENIQKMHPYAYIPFSAGPRNCIGYKFALLQMKTTISLILRRYQVAPVPGRQLKLAYRITLRAKGGVWLRLNKRKNEL